ncbi:MAG: hypothetical protein ACRDWW_03300, partial [Acidimicrobiales bacterium]
MSEIRGKPWLLAVAVFCLIAVAIAPIGAKRAAAQGTPAFLEPGQWLNSGQSLWATNEDGYGLELIMQTDGNLVEYGPNGALWASGSDTPNSSAIMQTDGNLVIYAPGGVAVWESFTNGHPNSTFVEQTDDNLV